VSTKNLKNKYIEDLKNLKKPNT